MSSNGSNFDPLAQYARLSERVENQGKDIIDLRSNMNTGFQGVNANLNALSNELRNNSRTQWPVIWAAAGVCFTILAAAGTFFYGTLSKGQDRLDVNIAKIGDSAMSVNAFSDWKATYENNRVVTRAEYIDKFNNIIAMIETIRKDQVPRAELERVWRSQDQVDAQLQKQVDEQKANSSAVYTPRDVLIDNRERIDRLERQRFSPGE